MMTSDLCTSPACIHIASHILNTLAINYTEIDPCLDFDQYVCGNWPSWHDIPPGQMSTDVMDDTRNDIYSAIRRIIESDYTTNAESDWVSVDWTEDQIKADKDIFKQVTEAYNVCLNDSLEIGSGLKTLAEFVGDIVSAFPAELGSDEKPKNLPQAMHRTLTMFETYGIPTTQRMVMQQDNLDPSETTILILANVDGKLPPTDEKLAATHYKLATKLLFDIYPFNITIKKAASLLKDVFKFQTQVNTFADASAKEEILEFAENPLDSVTPRTNLDQFNEDFQEYSFKHIIQDLAPDGVNISTIATPQSNYFRNLTQVLTSTPAEVLQTYFIWTAVSTLSPYVQSNVTSAWNAFQNSLEGDTIDSSLPKWQKCIESLDTGASWIVDSSVGVYTGPTGLTAILSRFFIGSHYSSKARQLTTEISKYLKEAFLERVSSHSWIMSGVKEVAKQKIHAMEDKIGFPADPYTLDPISLRKYYSNVNISSIHLENVLSLAKLTVGKKWAGLGKPWDRGQFKYSPLGPGAYQDRQLNALAILAGFQQFPFYDVEFPSYLLYGGMGSVVGHEITHGFDSHGRHYDPSGNMSEWWDKRSMANFKNKTVCFVEQYNNFTLTAPDGSPVNISGADTLDENIADAGGVAASYVAWKKWEEDKGKAQSLPGLEKFTNEQLFFVKWGQNFCRNWPAEVDIATAKHDSHSPKDARIKLTLDNTPAFKQAFNCPVKAPVCELW